MLGVLRSRTAAAAAAATAAVRCGHGRGYGVIMALSTSATARAGAEAAVEDTGVDVTTPTTGSGQHVGRVLLNRPRALNSLNIPMCNEVYRALCEWNAEGSSVGAFVMEGAGDKAFCAGGDVKAIYEEGMQVTPDQWAAGHHGRLTADFFRDEYRMNHAIGTSSVPQVSFWDGIVMGGGVGISVHGRFRVATEKTMFAMPETAIGLFPDVGGSYFLQRLHSDLGSYIGLTGVRLGAADLLYSGIATHYVPSESVAAVIAAMQERCTANAVANVQVIDNVLAEFAGEPDTSKATLEANTEAIMACFGGQATVEGIVAQVNAAAENGSEWAAKTAKVLARVSPTSMKITLESLLRAGALDLKGCLQMEYRMAQGCMMPGSDFFEGVRALLVDKDNSPQWNPSSLADVSDEIVQRHFAELPAEHELRLD